MLDKDFFSEESRERRKKEALEQHAKLAKMFREDRFSFELERKRLIGETINEMPEKMRESMYSLQEKINKRLNNAGSPYNRMVLMNMMFRQQVLDVFLPALYSFSGVHVSMQQLVDSVSKPQLRIIYDKEKSEAKSE